MNAVDKLLKLDAGALKMPEKLVKLKLAKLGGIELEFPCVGISPQKYSEIQENSYELKHGDIKRLNMHRMKTMTIIEGCPAVFKSKDILDRFHCTIPTDLVNTLLLSGEADDLKKAIDELNGYEEDEDDEDEIKN